MKILLAEYSVCAGLEGLANEGRAMLDTLRRSFEAAGCTVRVPRDFEAGLAELSRECDCFLLIAPDASLEKYTAGLEKKCINLGCSSRVIRLCADKRETTETLLYNGIPAPRLVHEKGVRCVVKPRYGCGAEGIFMSQGPVEREGFISTEYIEGEHLSVSLIGGKTMLPLTLNKQYIKTIESDGFELIHYDGNEVPYEHPAKREIFGVATKAGHMLGCQGLFGIDIVYGDRPYVVDVNPRPTTAVLALDKVLDANIADLILRARFGTLPESVGIKGHYSFTKADLEKRS
ncbi:MAG TPA: ATP-grasp domain-containing protein [Methanocella sp.]|uniref:ATP-grasp domain-containing protein n=1 Tax=Methanocella sp. TaxID=2052833 RepID=UPI002D05E5A5|nr:ATP-grasp domain-containing protein [Methanocella sp.]HTY91361.1 ATP-grasp domain-containing protein [Methanocella sp.]